MESWMLMLIASLCISLLFSLLFPSYSSRKKLVPGPSPVSFIGNILLFQKLSSGIQPILHDLISRYGPLVALRLGSFQAIIISSHSIAHQALVKRAAAFSGRPKAFQTPEVQNRHLIVESTYGQTWRLLRGNMTMGILKPSMVSCYSESRGETILMLIHRLRRESFGGASAVIVKDHLAYALSYLMVFMCLGKKLEKKQTDDIMAPASQLVLNAHRYAVIAWFPRLGKILFPGRLRESLGLFQKQQDLLIPLIRSRVEDLKKKVDGGGGDPVMTTTTYVDTLINLELPVEKRNLNEAEMVILCIEFIAGGTETTCVALEWIMANLVKYPLVQDKLYQELRQVLGTEDRALIMEKDLEEMPYLKAVVLEGLRRHSPIQYGIPHATTQDTELEGYVIPKNTMVTFLVAQMGLDPNVWEDPMEFKPERFLTSPRFDVTGSSEIKMMPFGAGRRICPAYGLALLHLELFVANLVWCFQWKHPPNHVVDLSENVHVSTTMKNPLRVHLSPR